MTKRSCQEPETEGQRICAAGLSAMDHSDQGVRALTVVLDSNFVVTMGALRLTPNDALIVMRKAIEKLEAELSRTGAG